MFFALALFDTPQTAQTPYTAPGFVLPLPPSSRRRHEDCPLSFRLAPELHTKVCSPRGFSHGEAVHHHGRSFLFFCRTLSPFKSKSNTDSFLSLQRPPTFTFFPSSPQALARFSFFAGQLSLGSETFFFNGVASDPHFLG